MSCLDTTPQLSRLNTVSYDEYKTINKINGWRWLSCTVKVLVERCFWNILIAQWTPGPEISRSYSFSYDEYKTNYKTKMSMITMVSIDFPTFVLTCRRVKTKNWCWIKKQIVESFHNHPSLWLSDGRKLEDKPKSICPTSCPFWWSHDHLTWQHSNVQELNDITHAQFEKMQHSRSSCN